MLHYADTLDTDANTSADRSRRALGWIYYAADAEHDEASAAAYQQQLAQRLANEGKI